MESTLVNPHSQYDDALTSSPTGRIAMVIWIRWHVMFIISISASSLSVELMFPRNIESYNIRWKVVKIRKNANPNTQRSIYRRGDGQSM